MATKRGIHGQAAPSSGVLTDIYTVPGAKNATVRVIISNRSATPSSFRVSAAIGGAADDVKQYIAYDTPIDGLDTGSTVPFMVDAGDIIRVRASLGNLSFVVTGLEQDV